MENCDIIHHPEETYLGKYIKKEGIIIIRRIRLDNCFNLVSNMIKELNENENLQKEEVIKRLINLSFLLKNVEVE